MIEWRWGLQPLSVRDEAARNLAEVLDFRQRNLSAPLYRVPFGPFGTPCPSGGLMAQQEDEWIQLRSLAQSYGWSLPYKVALPLVNQ
jgi:phospholipase C